MSVSRAHVSGDRRFWDQHDAAGKDRRAKTPANHLSPNKIHKVVLNALIATCNTVLTEAPARRRPFCQPLSSDALGRGKPDDLAGDLSSSGLLASMLDDSPAWGTIWSVHVELSCTAEKQLAKMPEYIVKKFALWVDLVSVDGLATARAIPGYRDHVLKGKWKGYRAIRLSNAYRAIYQERRAGTIQLVHVEEVNKHDY